MKNNPHPKRAIFNSLAISLITISLFTLGTISLFPLFSDEIQIRMWLSRLPYDFPLRVTGVARCFSAFSQEIPAVFYTPGLINWGLHGLIESPTFLRAVSIVILLAWLSVLIRYVYLKFNITHSKNYNGLLISAASILSIFFIGVNPIFIGINRNEQLYYPSIIILILITINSNKIQKLIYKNLNLGLILILISLILYGHPKGLFFIPLFLVISWQFSKSYNYPKRIFAALFIFIAYISFESHLSWSQSYRCPEIPEFEAFMKTFYFDPLSIFYNPSEFTSKAWMSIARFNEYPAHFEFKKEYIWNFLPGIKNFNMLHIVFNAAIKGLLVFAYLSVSISLIFFTIAKREKRNINFLLFTLILSTTIWAIFNLTKNIYDASFFYTITSIVIIFFVFENSIFKTKNKMFQILFFASLVTSLISQSIFVVNNFLPFINGFTGPGIRIGSYEFNKTHQAIEGASKACGIDRRNGKFIVIDDLTYGYFRKSHGPISYSYNGVGATKTPLQDLFRTVESDGMILYCPGFPAKFRQNAVHVDNICCISKSEIKRIFVDKDNSELD